MTTRNKAVLTQSHNQDGFILVVGLMVLVILSVIGIASIRTANIELQIAGNDRQEKQIFYGTESGCARGGQWLKNLQMAVIDDYITDEVRDAYVLAGNFTAAMTIHVADEDDESNLGDATYPVKYSYGISETQDTAADAVDCVTIEGFGPEFRECFYDVACAGASAIGGGRSIGVRVEKPTDFR